MVNPSGRLQLFHHFHHDVDDGLSDRTDEVWALQGGSSMAHTVAIRPGHLLNRQMGFHMDWTTFTWNSTDDLLDDVQRQLDLHAAKEEKPGQPPPAAGRSVRALASSTTTKRKPTASKGRQRQVEPLGDDALDDTDEKRRRRAGGFNHCTYGPIPAFITPALLADYKSDPVALC